MRQASSKGNIEEYLDDSYLPLQPRAMVPVLWEAGGLHDTKYRLLPWSLSAHQDQLQELSDRRLTERMKPLPFTLTVPDQPEADGDGAEQEARTQ